jgi:hypothetical protein
LIVWRTLYGDTSLKWDHEIPPSVGRVFICCFACCCFYGWLELLDLLLLLLLHVLCFGAVGVPEQGGWGRRASDTDRHEPHKARLLIHHTMTAEIAPAWVEWR